MFETREIFVPGIPRSQQTSSSGKAEWKRLVIRHVHEDVDASAEAIQWSDVAVQILHFCPEWNETDGDLDNIAKPILDALCESRRVPFDDNQVKELLLRRIEWRRRNIAAIENASERLKAWVDAARQREGPENFVYIRVTTELNLERLP